MELINKTSTYMVTSLLSLLDDGDGYYVRTETSSSIFWNRFKEPNLYQYHKSTDKWQICQLECEDCEMPDLERKYQELIKSCN